MATNVILTNTEYENLKEKSPMDSLSSSITLATGVIGMLIIFWQIATYVNLIKNDVAFIKKKLGVYVKKIDHADEFLLRRFKDYERREDDTLN